MRLTDIQVQNISELKQEGDRDELALLLKCAPETVSRITTGKQDTTLKNIRLIIKFYIKRQKLITTVANELS